MVNFRYHLVSLTAVFLALAAGITIGAGVVDRATVDRIEGQLRNVADRREATNAENDRLRSDLGRWGQFSEQAAGQIVEGRLTGTTVFLVGTSGVDRQIITDTRNLITAAGANVDGTLWFTGKWRLTEPEDARQLAGFLDAAPTTRAGDLRTAALIGITTAWGAGDSGPLVAALLDAGFFEFEASPATTVPLMELPRAGSLFVVVSGDRAEVAPTDLARPLVDGLVAARLPLVAAQPMRPPDDGAKPSPELPPEFVFDIREDTALASRITTVDNLDDFRGRVAAVLALRNLRSGRTGHYGFGPDTRVAPEPPP